MMAAKLVEEFINGKGGRHSLLINGLEPKPDTAGQPFKVECHVQGNRPDGEWYKADCQPSLYIVKAGEPIDLAHPAGKATHQADDKNHFTWIDVSFPEEGKWRLHFRNHKTPNNTTIPQYTTTMIFDIQRKKVKTEIKEEEKKVDIEKEEATAEAQKKKKKKDKVMTNEKKQTQIKEDAKSTNKKGSAYNRK